MAGVSTKDIKQRIRSMESTRQITRAMEMVDASKLRRPGPDPGQPPVFRDPLWHHCPHRLHPAGFFLPLSHPAGGKAGLLCCEIAGDRGLAGGYNNNVFKLGAAEMEGKELSVLPMGEAGGGAFPQPGRAHFYGGLR
ncbi:MAG: F0F1 ATP synthase subunit gamma [Oscillospiraceae bacterium]